MTTEASASADSAEFRKSLDRFALRTALVYAIAAAVWIRLSDRLSARLIHDQQALARISVFTDWMFICVTAALLYFILARQVHRWKGEVADRRRAEHAMREAQALYRSLVDNIPAGIFRKDAAGRFVFVNERFCRIKGVPSEEYLGRTAGEVADDLTKLFSASTHDWHQPVEITRLGEDHHKLIMQSGEPIKVEEEWIAADGSRRYFDAVKTPVFGGGGTVTGSQGALFEVTERKQAEAALRREEALFRDLSDTIPDHIYFKDRQSRFLRINEAMARSFELRQAADAIGKTDFDMFGKEHALEAYEDEQRIMETDQPMIGVEEKETWPDGRVTWVSTTKMPLRDAQGRIIGLLGISRDITKHKLADIQVREQNEILSNSHEGVMVVNLANEVSLWNHGAEGIFGWTAVEAIGRQPEQLLGVDNPGLIAALRAAVERDGFWNGELRTQARDGRKLVVDCRITLIRDAAGRPRARLNFLADITEKKLFEENLLHAQRIETIGMLAAGIAHDLNNVLAPIVMAAPILRGSLSAPSDLKMLDTLEASAARGIGLVKQILGFAHRAADEVRSTQVKHLLHDLVSIMSETFPKSIQLTYHIPSNLWMVQGNATQIHQVLLNLCVNARDAMPDGGTLHLAAANLRLDEKEARTLSGARPGAWLAIEVVDTGTGIAPDVLARIWEPFFTTKGMGKGTGLGLSTVRGIVASNHGFIDLRTQVGGGTTFRVFLPAIEGTSTADGNEAGAAAPIGKGELILLVDDDPAIRESVTAILVKNSYRVVSAANGVEAIGHFTAHGAEIALVITDFDMPDLGGSALAHILRQLRPERRLLVISGLSREDTGCSPLATTGGLTDPFLLKPFTREALLEVVHRLLHPTSQAQIQPLARET